MPAGFVGSEPGCRGSAKPTDCALRLTDMQASEPRLLSSLDKLDGPPSSPDAVHSGVSRTNEPLHVQGFEGGEALNLPPVMSWDLLCSPGWSLASLFPDLASRARSLFPAEPELLLRLSSSRFCVGCESGRGYQNHHLPGVGLSGKTSRSSGSVE